MISQRPIDELGGLTFAELEIVNHASGRLLFPEVLRRRDKTGKVIETKVRVWAPTPEDHIQARVDAREVASRRKLDRKEDRDIFEQIEQVCLLARAIRTYEAPHSQYCDADELATFSEGSLNDIKEKINAFKAAEDPRHPEVDEENFWAIVQAVARGATLHPLTDIDGRAQFSCIVRMAREACRSPANKSSAPLPGTSIPVS